MKKHILSTSLIATSLLFTQVASAGKGNKDEVGEGKQIKITVRAADLPKEFKASDNDLAFMQYISSLNRKSISSIDLKGWKGLSSDNTFYGTALIIKEQQLGIDEIVFSWGHMAMTHPVFKGKNPEEIEKTLFDISGGRTRFKLHFK